jgi:putative SOS response-associated peptidase YedK
MCYRVSIQRPIEEIEEFTERTLVTTESYTPHFHASGFIHPLLPVITCEEPHILQLSSWGFVPHYARTADAAKKASNMMLNARMDSLWQKTSFKESATYFRCLIIVDGFFEYHHWGSKKIPYYITMKSGKPMVMAGIYSRTKVDGVPTFTCAIVTNSTDRGSVLGRIHNVDPTDPRTPQIIHPGLEGEWLSNLPQGPILQDWAAIVEDEELNYWPITDSLAKKGFDADRAEVLNPVNYEGLNN